MINSVASSADFHQHATYILWLVYVECPIRPRFEITNLDRTDDGRIGRRLAADILSIAKQSDDEIASYIKRAEIDKLIHLNAFTQDAGTNIFA
jgi:predicted O-linked N-acetylglucosamine transferase (SPINDLY family)